VRIAVQFGTNARLRHLSLYSQALTALLRFLPFFLLPVCTTTTPLHFATVLLTIVLFCRSLQPQGLAETLCGSPLYMAPEILQCQKYDAKVRAKKRVNLAFQGSR